MIEVNLLAPNMSLRATIASPSMGIDANATTYVFIENLFGNAVILTVHPTGSCVEVRGENEGSGYWALLRFSRLLYRVLKGAEELLPREPVAASLSQRSWVKSAG